MRVAVTAPAVTVVATANEVALIEPALTEPAVSGPVVVTFAVPTAPTFCSSQSLSWLKLPLTCEARAGASG